MSKLIQLLIDDYQYGRGHVEQASTIEKELLRLYDTMNRPQRKGLSQSYQATVREIDEALSTRLTQELAQTHLLDSTQYELAKNAVAQWPIPNLHERESHLRLIKTTLLKLLPEIQKKQKLDHACQEYKTHLKNEIEAGLARHHPTAYDAYCTEQSTVKVIGNARWREVIPARNLDHFLGGEAKQLSIREDRLQKAVEKYQLVSNLQTTLRSPKPAAGQIEDFGRVFGQVKPVIEKSRDSWGMVFLKGLATLFSLGAAAALGIWSVKGAETAQAMGAVLEEKAPPPAATMTH